MPGPTNGVSWITSGREGMGSWALRAKSLKVSTVASSISTARSGVAKLPEVMTLGDAWVRLPSRFASSCSETIRTMRR